MNVARKISTNTCRRFEVRRRAADELADAVSSNSVVKSCTMTSVDGQYIAGRATRTLYRMPGFSWSVPWKLTCKTESDALRREQEDDGRQRAERLLEVQVEDGEDVGCVRRAGTRTADDAAVSLPMSNQLT